MGQRTAGCGGGSPQASWGAIVQRGASRELSIRPVALGLSDEVGRWGSRGHSKRGMRAALTT